MENYYTSYPTAIKSSASHVNQYSTTHVQVSVYDLKMNELMQSKVISVGPPPYKTGCDISSSSKNKKKKKKRNIFAGLDNPPVNRLGTDHPFYNQVRVGGHATTYRKLSYKSMTAIPSGFYRRDVIGPRYITPQFNTV